MKTGIYGGTFNPIHAGHLHILREFIKRLGLERVLLIPTGTPPHKNAPALASAGHRLAMCALASAEIEEVGVEISRIETDREGKSYTADTLEALRRQFPEDDLYLLMGEDMFLTVDKWYRPEVIFSLAALCASPRSADGMEKLREKKKELESGFGARCFIEDIPYLPISSTQIRELAVNGRALSGLVPESVEAYIRKHGIYGKEENPMTFEEYEAEVKKHLTPKRFYHSQCVAEEAARLAKRYGADVGKARTAGILHDVMKDTPPQEQLKVMRQFGIMLTSVQLQNQRLWHGISAAAYIQQALGVTDREIIDAIACHTGGKSGMGLMDKVLFVADYISADRDYPGVEKMRELAQSTLEEAMVEGLIFTVHERMEMRESLDPCSIDAYNEALKVLKENEGE